MTQEQKTSQEIVSPQAVYGKAKEILNLHGHPSTRQTLIFWMRPEGRPTNRRGPDMPTIEASVVQVEIAGNEYRLWLQQPQDEEDRRIQLSVHNQSLPYGFDRFEYDDDGRAIACWYKPGREEQLKRMDIAHLGEDMPKELHFSWYMASNYYISKDSIECKPSPNVRPEIADPIGNSNEFILKLLQDMQSKFQDTSSVPVA